MQIVAVCTLVAACNAGLLHQAPAVSSQNIVRHDGGHHEVPVHYSAPVVHAAPVHYVQEAHAAPVLHAAPIAHHHDEHHDEYVSW